MPVAGYKSNGGRILTGVWGIQKTPQVNAAQSFVTGDTYPLDAPGFLSNLATKVTCDLVDFLLNY